MRIQFPVKFAVVGCGHIGKRHALMIINNPHGELTALCDMRPKDELALNNFDVSFFTSIDVLLSSGISCDVVCIATPNGLHEEHAIKAIESGHHVVIEKPMALTKAGCLNIIAAATQYNKHIFCVMQNRYSPPAAWLKDILQQKILGKIFMVQMNCYWNRDEKYYTQQNWHGTKALDGGPLFTQFSHYIDQLYWLFGDLTGIKTKFNCFNHGHLTEFEDSGILTFNLENGGMGSMHYSTSVWNANLETSLTVIAENGSVKIGGQYMNRLLECSIKNYIMPVLPEGNPPNDYGTYQGSAANHHFVFENVIDVLQSNKAITTNALEGMKVVETIECIYSNRK
jgi:UDP-N-acetyl-2-amino-2-deoxyglucuronate dehydrogenase